MLHYIAAGRRRLTSERVCSQRHPPSRLRKAVPSATEPSTRSAGVDTWETAAAFFEHSDWSSNQNHYQKKYPPQDYSVDGQTSPAAPGHWQSFECYVQILLYEWHQLAYRLACVCAPKLPTPHNRHLNLRRLFQSPWIQRPQSDIQATVFLEYSADQPLNPCESVIRCQIWSNVAQKPRVPGQIECEDGRPLGDQALEKTRELFWRETASIVRFSSLIGSLSAADADSPPSPGFVTLSESRLSASPFPEQACVSYDLQYRLVIVLYRRFPSKLLRHS